MLIVSNIGETLYFYLISAILMILLFLVSQTFSNELVIDKKFIIIFAIYFVWLIFTLPVGITTLDFGYVILTPLTFLTLFLMFPQVIQKNKEYIPLFLSFSGGFLVFIGLIMLVVEAQTSFSYASTTGSAVLGGWNIRISSIFANSNNFGMYLCFASISSIYLYLQNHRYSTIFVGVNILGLILTDAQTSYLAFIAGLIIIFRYQYATYLVSLGMLLGTAFIIMTTQGIVDEVGFSEIFSGRNFLWQATVNRIIESPIFGVERGTSSTEIAPYIPEEAARQRGSGTHSTYLIVLLYNGVIGGIAYILAFWYLAIQSARSIQTEWGGYVTGGLCSIMVIMAFESLTFGGLSIVSILFATFAGLTHQQIIKQA